MVAVWDRAGKTVLSAFLCDVLSGKSSLHYGLRILAQGDVGDHDNRHAGPLGGSPW